ncbi:RidA family protein [Glycomyces terrestris]|uniref:RidA family protein n=1 Tax=Glycomyces terrestris TaxID=2493553 RepID=UPI0018D4E4B7|nr:RidA family protein [Glycomyces terrestris]
MTSNPRTFTDTRIAYGPLLFISGQVPVADDGAVPPDIAGQTALVFAKIAGHLAAHDLDWNAVVKVTYFLRDIGDLQAFREAALAALPAARPTASLVEVSALIDPRFLIEIEAVADLGARGDARP